MKHSEIWSPTYILCVITQKEKKNNYIILLKTSSPLPFSSSPQSVISKCYYPLSNTLYNSLTAKGLSVSHHQRCHSRYNESHLLCAAHITRTASLEGGIIDRVYESFDVLFLCQPRTCVRSPRMPCHKVYSFYSTRGASLSAQLQI